MLACAFDDAAQAVVSETTRVDEQEVLPNDEGVVSILNVEAEKKG
jgi:hypothetical protein